MIAAFQVNGFFATPRTEGKITLWRKIHVVHKLVSLTSSRISAVLLINNLKYMEKLWVYCADIYHCAINELVRKRLLNTCEDKTVTFC